MAGARRRFLGGGRHWLGRLVGGDCRQDYGFHLILYLCDSWLMFFILGLLNGVLCFGCSRALPQLLQFVSLLIPTISWFDTISGVAACGSHSDAYSEIKI